MRKTEVYQIRLDSQEKKQAFAVFKHLGITPAQAVRLFFKQAVLTKSIPFSIENQNINLEQLIELRKLKEQKSNSDLTSSSQSPLSSETNQGIDNEHFDLFEELNAILDESDKINNVAFINNLKKMNLKNLDMLQAQIK